MNLVWSKLISPSDVMMIDVVSMSLFKKLGWAEWCTVRFADYSDLMINLKMLLETKNISRILVS